MEKISTIQKLGFRIKNLPGIRKVIENNRWVVRLYFENRYRSPDPYQTTISQDEIERIEHIFQLVRKNRYRHILDIGCGEGYLVEKLIDLADRITALDLSKIALNRLRKRLGNKTNISFICTDSLSWQTQDQFDLIICTETLYYLNLDQIKMLIPRLINWLSPGGGRLLLAHIVTKEESDIGLPLKKLGAKTIHPLFMDNPGLKTIYNEACGRYILTMLEKVA